MLNKKYIREFIERSIEVHKSAISHW